MASEPKDPKFQPINISRGCVALADEPSELPSETTGLERHRAQQRLWRRLGGRSYVARRLGVKGASLGHTRQGTRGISAKHIGIICRIAQEIEERTGKAAPVPLGLFDLTEQAASHEQAASPKAYRESRTPEQLAVIASRREKGIRAKATAARNGTVINLNSRFNKTFSPEELNKAGLGPKNLKALAQAGLAVEMQGNLPMPVCGPENSSVEPLRGERNSVTLSDGHRIKFSD